MRKITGITATVLASLLCVFNFALPGTALTERLASSGGEDETSLFIPQANGETSPAGEDVAEASERPHLGDADIAGEIHSGTSRSSFWTDDHAIALVRLLL